MGVRATGYYARTGELESQAEQEESQAMDQEEGVLGNFFDRGRGESDEERNEKRNAQESTQESYFDSTLAESPAASLEALPVRRVRNRTRSLDQRPIGNDTSPVSGGRKRLKVVQESLATVMKEVVDEAVMPRIQGAVSKQELAIKVLQDNYENKLDDDDMVKAAMVLEVYEKACVFTAFRGGRPRDAWLKKEIERSILF